MDQERTYKWIQERLRDLQSGRITEADLLRLDEMAKTDPFLADAIAGYRAHPHIDHSERLHTIAHKVRFRKEVKRKWLMPAIAASLLAVAGIWTLVDLTSREKMVLVAADQQAPPVYEETTTDLRRDESIAEDMAVAESAEEGTSSPSGLRAHAQSKMESNKTTTPPEDGVMLSDTKMESSDDIAVAEPMPPSTTSDMEVKQDVATGSESPSAVQGGTTNESARNQAYDEGLYANQMDPSFMRKRVTGQVIDVNFDPIIGASVVVSSSTLGTLTDFYGRFEIFIPEKTAVLEANYTGYEDSFITATQGQEDLVFIMQGGLSIPPAPVIPDPTMQSKQKILIAQNNKRKETQSAFYKFIQNYSQFPISNEISPITKEVKLDFKINSSGKPTQIIIARSSGEKKFEEEAIRLLKEGPSWNCAGNNFPCKGEFYFFFQ